MYCPSCGTESTGLKYCNRCGANLTPSAGPTEIRVRLTAPAAFLGLLMTFLTLGGFVLLIIGARVLAPILSTNDPIIALIFMGIVTILTVDIFLARQLSKLINAALKPDWSKTGSNQIGPIANAPQLPRTASPHFQPSSVTENTTRFFDPAQGAPQPLVTPHEKDR